MGEKCICGGTLKRIKTSVIHPGNAKIIKGTKVVCSKCG